MNLSDLLSGSDGLVHDTVQVSLPGFMPELVLCATIVILLVARLFPLLDRISSFWIALAGSLVALVFAVAWQGLPFVGDPTVRTEIFTGLLVYDQLTVFFRTVLLVFAVLFVLLTGLTGFPDREDGPDFYSLVLGATLGMCIMASANHLLMVFLGVEMASVPSYVLAGIVRRRKASEAAIKYSVYGAGTAGVMLYGISLLAGATGTAHLPTLATQLADMISSGTLGDRSFVLILGGLMVAVGLAFKLSAVPFHFWCPDVFEGATAEIDAFLSVASKAAALALLIRVAVGFSYVPDSTETVAMAAPADSAQASSDAPQAPPDEGSEAARGDFLLASYQADGSESGEETKTAGQTSAGGGSGLLRALAPVRNYVAALVGLLAAITCTFGNLAAYGQTNIKRLMAYSTIGHAGYMMMPVAAAVTLIGRPEGPQAAESAIAALTFYVAVYLFMNLGAFAIIALVRNEIRSEEIDDYSGLLKSAPGVTICFSVILVSLIGIPPLAGFVGKFLAFASLASAGLWVLFVIGAVNAVISLFYYLRVVKVMTLGDAPESRLPMNLPLTTSLRGAYVLLITLPVIIFGIGWDQLNELAKAAAGQILY